MAAKKKGSIYGAMHPAIHNKQRRAKPKPEPVPAPVGPTLTEAFNRVFAVWQLHQLAPQKPTCECCGTDLTNQLVFDIGEWVCQQCYHQSGFVEPAPVLSDKEVCKVCRDPISYSEKQKGARTCGPCRKKKALDRQQLPTGA